MPVIQLTSFLSYVKPGLHSMLCYGMVNPLNFDKLGGCLMIFWQDVEINTYASLFRP